MTLAQLRELAKSLIFNSTRGKWFARETYVYQSNDPRDHRQVCRVPTAVRPGEVEPTAAYIAEVSPVRAVPMIDVCLAVKGWREAVCKYPRPSGMATWPEGDVCDGDNHLEDCPVELARQDVIAAHNKLEEFFR